MYTIKEASVRSGVGIPLLRAWERRYGVVAPTRSAGGYRLYDGEAIDRLRAMRHLIDSGWSAQQAASRIRSLGVSDLDDLLTDAPPTGNGSTSRESIAPDLAADLVDRMVKAASAVDSASLDVALDEAFGSARFEVVIDRIVMPALRAIGDGWEAGRIDVSGEHAASHAILRRLSMAFEAAGDPPATAPDPRRPGPGEPARARRPRLRRRRASSGPAGRLPRTRPPGRELGCGSDQPRGEAPRSSAPPRFPTCGG